MGPAGHAAHGRHHGEVEAHEGADGVPWQAEDERLMAVWAGEGGEGEGLARLHQHSPKVHLAALLRKRRPSLSQGTPTARTNWPGDPNRFHKLSGGPQLTSSRSGLIRSRSPMDTPPLVSKMSAPHSSACSNFATSAAFVSGAMPMSFT